MHHVVVGCTTGVPHQSHIEHGPHHVAVSTHVTLLYGELVLMSVIEALQLVALGAHVLRVREGTEWRSAQRGHRGAHHVCKRLVDLHEPPLEVYQGHPHGCAFHGLAEVGIGPPQCLCSFAQSRGVGDGGDHRRFTIDDVVHNAGLNVEPAHVFTYPAPCDSVAARLLVARCGVEDLGRCHRPRPLIHCA